MFDSDIQELYFAQMFTHTELAKIADALDPRSKTGKIAELSSLPAKVINNQIWTDRMRTDEGAREDWYIFENTKYVTTAVNMLEQTAMEEAKLYGLCTAVEEFYRTKNEVVPADLRAESQKALKESQKRVSGLIKVLDEIRDEAVDEIDKDNDISTQIENRRQAAHAEHLNNLRTGKDYRTLRDVSLNFIAGYYLNTAKSFMDSAGFHAVIQVLRLEAETTTFGGVQHKHAYKLMRNDLKHAKIAIDLAKQASPENAAENVNQLTTDFNKLRPS